MFREANDLGDFAGASFWILYVEQELELSSFYGAGEGFPVIRRRHALKEGGFKIGWFHQILNFVKLRPASVLFGEVDEPLARGMNQPERLELFDALLVDSAPSAAWFAGRDEKFRAQFVDLSTRPSIQPKQMSSSTISS